MKLINEDTDNGMTANVVNSEDGSDEPWKLLIALSDTGDGNKAMFPNLYLVDGEVIFGLMLKEKLGTQKPN